MAGSSARVGDGRANMPGSKLRVGSAPLQVQSNKAHGAAPESPDGPAFVGMPALWLGRWLYEYQKVEWGAQQQALGLSGLVFGLSEKANPNVAEISGRSRYEVGRDGRHWSCPVSVDS